MCVAQECVLRPVDILFQINVRDSRHAKYVESTVPINDLRAFVFQKQQDMERFMTEVRAGNLMMYMIMLIVHDYVD